MQPDKYQNNPLGLPPSFLSLCEALGRAFVELAKKHHETQKESQIVDTDYEEITPNQLPINTEDWQEPENDHWDNY